MAFAISRTMNSLADPTAELTNRVACVGGAVEKLVTHGTRAFLEGRVLESARSAESRKRISEAERDCVDFALTLLAQREPSPGDARAIVASLEIADAYKRIADLWMEIASRPQWAKLLPELPELDRTYPALLALTANQLQIAGGALRSFDAGLPRTLFERDRAVRMARAEVLFSAVRMLRLTPRTMYTVVDALACARSMQRISAYATSIADAVVFMKTGREEWVAVQAARPAGRHVGEAA